MKRNALDVASHGGVHSRGQSLTARIRGTLATLGLLGLVAILTAATLANRADLVSVSNSTEGNIAKLTANILEHSQFAHHPLDAELAGNFLDRYLDVLDGSHALFVPLTQANARLPVVGEASPK